MAIASALDDRLAALHARELPQKDNLCGSFWGALVLRAAGITGVDQDEVAAVAGTALPPGDPATFVPPGEEPRQDYRVELPLAASAEGSGTAAPTLAFAIERLSGASLAALPVAGPWSAAMVERLLDTAASVSEVTLIANVRSGRLWGSRPGPSVVLGWLLGEDVEPPPAEWDVGHFVNLAALVRGPLRALVVVRDSYASLGWRGHHLQPPEAVAAALERGDGREGGVLCVCPSANAEELRDRLAAGGFDLRHWDNGAPAA